MEIESQDVKLIHVRCIYILIITFSLFPRDDSRAGRKALLGENIGGRSNVVSDKNFRDNNPALRGHKGKKDGTCSKDGA